MPQTAEAPAPAPDIPVLGGPVPYINVVGAGKAADFYVKAFGAEEIYRIPEDEQGRSMHVHLYLNGGSLMISDFYAEHGYPPVKPQGFSIHLNPNDIDAAWQRAVDAGCTVVMPLQLMFWGDRYGQLTDPFGVSWTMGKREK